MIHIFIFQAGCCSRCVGEIGVPSGLPLSCWGLVSCRRAYIFISCFSVRFFPVHRTFNVQGGRNRLGTAEEASIANLCELLRCCRIVSITREIATSIMYRSPYRKSEPHIWWSRRHSGAHA